MKLVKIAIYSGEISSTTFIERLISGMSEQGIFQILLFGHIKNTYSYNSNVKVIGNTHKISKLGLFIKYSFLLWLFKNKEKKKLDAFLFEKNKKSINYQVKFYPVLYHHPDIFHIQWAKSLSEWIWVKDFGIKLVLSLRGSHITYSPIADKNLAESYRKNFNKVDRFHAVSKDIVNEAAIYGDIKDRFDVIYSGIDKTHSKRFKKSDNKIFSVLSVGRSHWVKGYHYALDSFKILKELSVPFKYTIIGVDQNNEELYFQRAQLNLENEVLFISALSHNEVMNTMKEVDLLLLPSIKEGVANVVIEAMSIGTLVLAADTGGLSEVVSNGINGFLCPIRDPQKMAASMIYIINLTSDEVMKIKNEAIELIENQHSYQKMISQFVQFYNDIANA